MEIFVRNEENSTIWYQSSRIMVNDGQFCKRWKSDLGQQCGRRMPRIPLLEHVSKEETLGILRTKKSYFYLESETKTSFLGHIMKKEDLKNLTLTGCTEDPSKTATNIASLKSEIIMQIR